MILSFNSFTCVDKSITLKPMTHVQETGVLNPLQKSGSDFLFVSNANLAPALPCTRLEHCSRLFQAKVGSTGSLSTAMSILIIAAASANSLSTSLSAMFFSAPVIFFQTYYGTKYRRQKPYWSQVMVLVSSSCVMGLHKSHTSKAHDTRSRNWRHKPTPFSVVSFRRRFLPRDASAERGDATVSCPSVRL